MGSPPFNTLFRENFESELEDDGGNWRRILKGLPIGQLSFILRAASDTLPTPLNLKRWSYKVSARCSLCNFPSPTVSHILIGCPLALSQGRYTWRHDSVLHSLVNDIKTSLDSSYNVFL